MDNSLLAVRDINHKYIVVEKEDELIKTKQHVDEIKSEYAEKKMMLDLKEVFIDGGFRKEEYEGIIKRISCPTDEEKLDLAKEIVKIKK